MDRRRGRGRSGAPPPHLGPRVRDLRTAAKKTAAEAAAEAGVTEAEWLAVEEGRRGPALAALVGMARALGCSAGDLLADEGVQEISPSAKQAAALFEQCPVEVQASLLNLLRGVMGNRQGKKKR